MLPNAARLSFKAQLLLLHERSGTGLVLAVVSAVDWSAIMCWLGSIDMLPVILVFLRLPQSVSEEHLVKAGDLLAEF